MTQKVEVAFGLAFIQLINVNEKNQIMKSNVWFGMTTSFSGTRRIMGGSVFSGCLPTKFGSRI